MAVLGRVPRGARVTRLPDAHRRVEQVSPEDRGLLVDVLAGIVSLAWQLARAAAEGVWRFPVTVGVLLAAYGVWRAAGLLWLAASGAGLLLVGLSVRWVRPSWWTAARGLLWRYRVRRSVASSWSRRCDRLGLTVTEVDQRTGVRTCCAPGLSHLHWAPAATGRHRRHGVGVLSGRVRLVPGQCVEDVAGRADRLAAAAGADSVRVTCLESSAAEVTWLFGNPLAETVAPLPADDPVDVAGLPVGVREDGGLWRLRLASTHLLVVGVTGAGKGSVIWSLLAALGPAIRDGWVQVWAVDGKAGMEFAPGRALFTRFATTVETAVELLEDAAAVMAARAARLADEHLRAHAPTVATVAEPLLVVLVDEVALLTAYVPDRKVEDRAEKALAVIATQGRAPGVVLVAALQDPRKEVLGLRNLFPTKIGMRLDEKAQVDMVLGDGAREAGAACHQIAETTPGVAYVRLDGHREPVRVRAAHLDDEHIARLAATYPAPTSRLKPAAPAETGGAAA